MMGELDAVGEVRGTFVFFPWVAIDTEICHKGIRLHTWEEGQPVPPGGEAHLHACQHAAGRRIERATLVSFDGEVGGEITDEQLSAALVLKEVLAFTALRQKEFFGFSKRGYWNANQFAMIPQNYKGLEGGASIVPRSRGGRTLCYYPPEYYRRVCPFHVEADRRFKPDPVVVQALLAACEDARCKWAPEAIVEFNLANTDSDDIAPHAELALTSAALQLVVGVTKSRHELIAAGLDRHIGTFCKTKRLDDCPRLSGLKKRELSLLSAWFYDMYRSRGGSAHGQPQERTAWSLQEHLLLLAYILPRLVLVRLSDTGHYKLTEKDHDELAAIEYLLCIEPDLHADKGQAWTDAIWEASNERSLRKILDEMEEEFPSDSGTKS